LKSGKRLTAIAVAGLCLAGAFVLRADMQEWVQHLPAGAALSVLLRTVGMPGGEIQFRRPPAETIPALTSMIAAGKDASLFRLRAREEELAENFTAAESDWNQYAGLATDSAAAHIELADFYHRRLRSRDEIAALMVVTRDKSDLITPVAQQRPWQAFERMTSVVSDDGLPEADAQQVLRAWVSRYPRQPTVYQRLIGELSSHGQYAAADQEIAAYAREFHDDLYPVRARAELQLDRGNTDAAVRIYDAAFQPAWPDDMTKSWFDLLEQQQRLREFVGRARAALQTNPADLNATARLFHYFRSQNNAAAAGRSLIEYRLAKESGKQPWTADELLNTALLFERLPDVNEAARLWYALYSVPGGTDAHRERALYGLANLLLTQADQPVRFGSGDLSFYKDIATIDQSPGFLNGILSLILNGTGPRWAYQDENGKSAPYFHRAAASQLLALLEHRFPRSDYREPLRAALIAAYANYGADNAVIQAGQDYLNEFPEGGQRFATGMLVADALASQNKLTEEFALYNRFLRELSAKAKGVPIGDNLAAGRARDEDQPGGPGQQDTGEQAGLESAVHGLEGAGGIAAGPQFGVAVGGRSSRLAALVRSLPAVATPGVRSPEYVQVLDRYLSRLASLKRPMDALRVYRAELDRNPNDPGLYERLASFLDENNMTAEVEQTYRQAIGKFPDRSWYHKLARWYLRRKENDALGKISKEAVGIFSGTELEAYFAEVLSETLSTQPVFYRQLNLYAHQRFPEDLVFVHNLIAAYSQRSTADPKAALDLYRSYWFYDDALRTAFFQYLAKNGLLTRELQAVRKEGPANLAAVQFTAEAEIWQSHFEAAAPAMKILADASPGQQAFTGRASSLYRSLGKTDLAVHFAEAEYRSDARNRDLLARIGDIYADREQFTRARPVWNRMTTVEAGRTDAWLDSATVFWDYFLFDDAFRVISAARKRFENPALFAYQAGAIHENKRQYASAVEQYVAGALAGDEQCSTRLGTLSIRDQTKDLVDKATARAVQSNADWPAIDLRISILDRQQRHQDMETLLASQISLQKSPATLDQLATVAQTQGFEPLQARALARQIELTNDPVEKMRLTLALVHLDEGRKDIAAAAHAADALWRDHPEILGVIRGVVDFHVRNKQPAEAVSILLDAAKRARADLAQQFTFEAARISTDAGNLPRARELLSKLLAADPYRAEYLTAMADTFLRAKDDQKYRDFQLATITALRASPLAPEEKTEHIAALRRSLIPVLTRLGDYAAAVEQYMLVINSFPEDEALTREAASYAMARRQTPPLLAFYRKTVSSAPRDYRWPIVLARIETVMEDYPAAIADYDRAMKARPDRGDIVEARAGLEERLMRFADAERSYLRLYELSYHAPEWMEKVAETRARLGRRSDTVDALKVALIGAHSETAEADFTIADRLETWHMTEEAVGFAERGAELAGADQRYARIMTEARRFDAVLKLVDPAAKNPVDVSEVVGGVVAALYAPEEKAAFEKALVAKAAGMTNQNREALLLPFATAAGMVDLETRWRLDTMMQGAPGVDARFVTLENSRARYSQLAQELEQYAALVPRAWDGARSAALSQSVTAWSAAGDVDAQLRIMADLERRNQLSGEMLDRYLSLLAALHPGELVRLAAETPQPATRNQAVQWAIRSGNRDLAYRALQIRGGQMKPVWAKAYTALAGVYFADTSSGISAAFTSALDTRTISERVASPPKPDSNLIGAVWFYYGARYGEYLDRRQNAQAGDYLPATTEESPAAPDRYLALGDYYAAAHQPEKAIAQYDLVLQLDPDRGDAYDHMARTEWSAGRHDLAIEHWHAALAALLRVESAGGRLEESFWGRATETFRDIGDTHILGVMKPDIERLLADYIDRNASYELRPLLSAAFQASLASGENPSWVLQLVEKVEYGEEVVQELTQIPELTETQRIELERTIVAINERKLASLYGDAHTQQEASLAGVRLGLISRLLDDRMDQQAEQEWNRLPEGVRDGTAPAGERSSIIEIRLAVAAGKLDALLEQYRSKPETAPGLEDLRTAAQTLRADRKEAAAIVVLDFLYTRELDAGHLDAANFLGLAEVRLRQKNDAAALQLLHRMALVTDNPFDTLLPAADLFDKYGRTAAAAEFVSMRLRAAPWDGVAKLHAARLAQGTQRHDLLAAVVTDPLAAYSGRAEAARLIAPEPALLPGTELGLLSSGHVTPAAADAPYFVEARVLAADGLAEGNTRLRLFFDALAIAPLDQRARVGALRAALAIKSDSIALSLVKENNAGQFLASAGLSDADRASLAEQLAAAAERLEDLTAAVSYLQAAIDLRPENQRAADTARRETIEAEQTRRNTNAARMPSIRDVVDQDHAVEPLISRTAP
jgi:cellulose synthase operon protein C